ncbi:CCAAT/enhancer-binding protein zeta [Sesamum indicum]|uniref:CCAAT/enhancer-binding protein zeta n=1 Tax=Sesamum indicum TaxID=4182 RepID=A0A6I9SY84_SESIN|nr:CCAAT/enhancer-binding protein zeta [Sesamum indicum]
MVAVRKPKPSEDTAALQSELASFASSLGFSSASAPSSGFNDSDFRKTGPIKPHSQSPSNTQKNSSQKNFNIKNRKANPRRDQKPTKNQKYEPRNSNLLAETDNNRFKNLPKLPLVKSSALGVWHDDAAELEEKLIGKDKKIEFNSVEEWRSLVEKKKELGERLLVQYAQDYMSSRGQHGDIKMLVATQRSGTAADKVSALSVLIGDNAIANLRSIDSLLGMVTSKVGKRHAFTAFEALKEIFIILLPDRKLKTLFQRPLNHLPDTKDGYSLLLFWHWEECLKERYEKFISALEEASLDVIVKLKSMALKTIYMLLKSKSEQERRLLSSLVNKLGDPENKVASNADYHLANLLTEHPNMKAVVIDEVDTFLFRPRLGLRAKYHAVNFLSQIRLSHKGDGPKAAKRLIDIYFALFKVLISEAGATPSAAKQVEKASSSSKKDKPKGTSETHVEMDSRLLSALLAGVNRAFPFVSTDEADDVIEVQTPLLFQLVHSKNFNVGVQALMLLDKISSKNQIVSDRFYRALYSKLLLPAAMNSSKEEMFIALILRAMKNDINIKRVAAFSKRLLQVALQLPPQYASGCLFLLSEVLKARPPLWNVLLQNEAADADEDLEHFEDITEDDDNQVIPVPNRDNNGIVADIKKESDDDSESSPSESGSASSGSEGDTLNDTDDLLGEGGLNKLEEFKPTSDHEVRNHQGPMLPQGYNPRHREPTYCNADKVGWWELMVLASHVHPSVAAMARTLLSGVNIVYNGNPLSDLSLGAFLDKFMEKKPKQSIWHGASQIEPAKKIDMNHQLIGSEILSLAESDVPPEDVVFHKFYLNKMNSSKKPKKKKKKTAEDEAAEELYAVDGDEDGSDDEEIDNMLDSVNPTSEEGEYDYDDLDKIADEDDEDLIANGSDEELDIPSDIEYEDIENGETSSRENSDNSDSDVAIGEADDGSDDDVAIGTADDGSDFDDSFDQRKIDQRKKKRRTFKDSGASPFASLEDYQHLMEDNAPESNSSMKKKRNKSKKKRKVS